MGKYSFLMSVYKKEKPDNLRRSIESMLNQTCIPNEIVIVKDGPLTDQLDELIQEYEDEYPKLFNIVVSEKNLGLGLALNLGLEKCKNELVARMDSDDISVPLRCELQLKAFQADKKLGIVGGYISEFVFDENNIIGKRIVPIQDSEIKNYIKKRCPLNHVTVMFKKSKVYEAGNYCDWFWNEDYYLWIRMYEIGCKFGNIPEVLVNVRVGPDMYNRRGGIKYFISEANLQTYMFKKKNIGLGRYIYNVGIRFIIQVALPNVVRGFIFKKFARSK